MKFNTVLFVNATIGFSENLFLVLLSNDVYLNGEKMFKKKHSCLQSQVFLTDLELDLRGHR